jgi:hypothetical protein
MALKIGDSVKIAEHAKKWFYTLDTDRTFYVKEMDPNGTHIPKASRVGKTPDELLSIRVRVSGDKEGDTELNESLQYRWFKAKNFNLIEESKPEEIPAVVGNPVMENADSTETTSIESFAGEGFYEEPVLPPKFLVIDNKSEIEFRGETLEESMVFSREAIEEGDETELMIYKLHKVMRLKKDPIDVIDID